MRRIKITSKDRSLLQGFILGVEWVNDSAICIIDCDDHSLLLEDSDSEGDEEETEFELTDEGFI